MFHFLVNYEGWATAEVLIQKNRVFENTDPHLVAQFMPNDRLDSKLITTLPALFASETTSPGDHPARVGSITDARDAGGKVRIEYVFDNDIPPIANSNMRKLEKYLGISSTEFSRTHWAIKNADLFKVLFRNHVTLLPSPKVFKLDQAKTTEKNLLSVMMPFEKTFEKVYATIQSTAKALKMECLRADDIWMQDVIIQDIVDLICRSHIVVCDCTGRNANVFYETGIAHTLGREVILITQSETDIPFNVRHIRHLPYLNNREGRQQLAKSLQQRIQTLLNLH